MVSNHHDGSMGRFGIFTDPFVVDFYGKCKVNIPYMDPMGIYIHILQDLHPKDWGN